MEEIFTKLGLKGEGRIGDEQITRLKFASDIPFNDSMKKKIYNQ